MNKNLRILFYSIQIFTEAIGAGKRLVSSQNWRLSKIVTMQEILLIVECVWDYEEVAHIVRQKSVEMN